jgi:CxxC-x17-CxxC domain-containing protein
MALADQTLYCRDCNQEFAFTVGEQEFYASRGFTNTPTRCPSCRATHKAQSGGRSRSPRGGNDGGYREARQMYTATCASCGNEAQVPFQPREDRPVYCSNCFQSQGSSSSRGGSDRRSRW